VTGIHLGREINLVILPVTSFLSMAYIDANGSIVVDERGMLSLSAFKSEFF